MSHIPVVIGTYNAPEHPGLFSLWFNQDTGVLTPAESLNIDNASFFTFSNDGEIFCISEMDVHNSFVYRLRFDDTKGGMEIISRKPLTGSPCYVIRHDDFAATANYGGGTLNILPMDRSGDFTDQIYEFHGETGGPDAQRQNLPHIHCVETVPDGKTLLASDFSADRIMVFDVVKGQPFVRPRTDEAGNQVTIPLKPDSGTRHLVFDREGRHLYVIGELSGEVTVFEVKDGAFLPKQTITADPFHERASAHIAFSPDYRFLYASNRRRNDGITIFEVNNDTGELTLVGNRPTGKHPRHFAVSPNGKFILVACRDDNSVEVYERNSENGMIGERVSCYELYRPVCIAFKPGLT